MPARRSRRCYGTSGPTRRWSGSVVPERHEFERLGAAVADPVDAAALGVDHVPGADGDLLGGQDAEAVDVPLDGRVRGVGRRVVPLAEVGHALALGEVIELLRPEVAVGP